MEKPEVPQFGILPCVSARNGDGPQGFVPSRSDLDADDEGTATGDPHGARMGDSPYCRKPAPSANATITVGCRTVPTRTPASAPLRSHAGIRRPASPRKPLPSRFAEVLELRSAKPAPSIRPNKLPAVAPASHAPSAAVPTGRRCCRKGSSQRGRTRRGTADDRRAGLLYDRSMSSGAPPHCKIIHIDMDAFYASVEQRDDPDLRGKPVAVGGSAERGVVAAASHEAPKFGVARRCPPITAKRQCPDLIFVKPRFEVYKAISRQIREIFAEASSPCSRRNFSIVPSAVKSFSTLLLGAAPS